MNKTIKLESTSQLGYFLRVTRKVCVCICVYLSVFVSVSACVWCICLCVCYYGVCGCVCVCRGVGSKFGLVRQILCSSQHHKVHLRGSGGMPPRKILKMDALRLNLVAFLTLQYNVQLYMTS